MNEFKELAKALKIEVEFYCTREGSCPRKHVCIGGYAFTCSGGCPFIDICPHLVIKAKAEEQKGGLSDGV